MNRQRTRRMLAVAAVLALPASGWASIVYHYEARPSTTTIGPGASLLVPVYLTETVTDGSSSLLQAEGGLYSSGFQMQASGWTGSAASTLTLITINSAFGGNPSATLSADHLTARLDENVGTSFIGVASSSGGAGVQELLLGTVQITGAATAGTTSYSLGGIGTTMTNQGNVLDSDGTGYGAATGVPFTITVAVPEPTSVGLLGVAGVLGLRRRANLR